MLFIFVMLLISSQSTQAQYYHDIINANGWMQLPLTHPETMFDTDYSIWMAQNMDAIGSLTVSELIFPGTHDSGAYSLTTDIGPDATGSAVLDALVSLAEKLGLPLDQVITPWALAQDRNFYQQMMGGIRYFDLRSMWNGTTWRTGHFELGVEVSVLLADIKQFLTAANHEAEIVLVEVSHLGGNPTEQNIKDLVSLFESTFGSLLLPADADSLSSVPLSSLVSSNKRVLLTCEGGADSYSKFVWPSSTFFNTYANQCSYPSMLAFNNVTLADFRNGTSGAPSSSLFKLSWTLTPNVECILGSVLPGAPHSLRELADVANSNWDNFVSVHSSCSSSSCAWPSVILSDDFASADFVRSVIQLNRNRTTTSRA